MTVDELIAELRKYPGDMNVQTGGFDEHGFDDIRTVEPVTMYNVSDNPAFKVYRDASQLSPSERKGDPLRFILIDR